MSRWATNSFQVVQLTCAGRGLGAQHIAGHGCVYLALQLIAIHRAETSFLVSNPIATFVTRRAHKYIDRATSTAVSSAAS